MIKYLTNSQFSIYGQIYTEDINEINNVNGMALDHVCQLNVSSASIRCLFHTVISPVLLKPVEGIALLCVSHNPAKDDIEVFLLDKPVSINNGIFYNVIPLYGVCSVLISMSEDNTLEEVPLNDEFTPLGSYPKVEINKIFTLFYQEKGKEFMFKGEKHNFWELTYVDKGTLYSSVDGKAYVINKGELIFYKENQYHMQWSKENEGVSFVTVTFDMNFNSSRYLSDKVFSADEEFKDTIKKILMEENRDQYYSNELIICYLKILIIKLIRNQNFENTMQDLDSKIKSKINNSIVENTLFYIHKNINKKMSISEISGFVHVSQSYLSTVFKKVIGMTIVDYINKYRLDQSKHLLMESDYNITQIADMLGFASIHYFSRQFKSHFGLSPSEYIKSLDKK